MPNWVLLHYTIAARPSARRVYVWRKLKRLGAVLLQNAIWILPDTPRTAEHFRWLATEIQEMHGEALVWKANLVLGVEEQALVQKFLEQVEADYARLLAQLKEKKPDLGELSREYQLIQARDYFRSALGRQVREKLIAMKGSV